MNLIAPSTVDGMCPSVPMHCAVNLGGSGEGAVERARGPGRASGRRSQSACAPPEWTFSSGKSISLTSTDARPRRDGRARRRAQIPQFPRAVLLVPPDPPSLPRRVRLSVCPAPRSPCSSRGHKTQSANCRGGAEENACR